MEEKKKKKDKNKASKTAGSAGNNSGKSAGSNSEKNAEKSTAKNTGRKINREILTFAYLFLFVFAAFVGYFVWFQERESGEIINNTYNGRIESLEERTIRGQILSNDGTILAETVVDEEGNETRYYPYSQMLAHTTGYIGRGKTGVESLANYYLLNSHQSIWTQFANDITEEKNIGDNVMTTIDLDLQQAAWDAMDGRTGAAVVLEASTGKILAMVSNPGFDPNQINEDWEELTAETNHDANLLNRATQGLYPPGSTFKLVTLLEFIREYPDTWQDFTYDCQGVNEGEGYTIRCYDSTAHGHLDLEGALVASCNGAFAAIGQMLDPDRFTETCTSLLFNQKLPLGLANNASSFSLTDESTPWTVARTAIGQGETQITPLLSAMITAAIANDGVMMQPYILDSVWAGNTKVESFDPVVYGTVMSEEEVSALKEMMRAVITDGTANSLKTDLYEAYGKTGTAEYITGADTTHAWFTGFAGEGDEAIAVSVILEGAGTGSSQAAPVAAAIFEAHFSR